MPRRRKEDTRYTDGFSVKDLCEGLGCSPDRIQQWIALGWLRVRNRSSAPDGYSISAGAIRELVARHPFEIDPAKADWLWLVDILVGGTFGIGSLSPDSQKYNQDGRSA
jgi:hypothetical protein